MQTFPTLRRYSKKQFICFSLAMFLPLCFGSWMALSQSLQDDEGYALFEQPGRMISLPTGNRLSLYCVGTGGPTVVLETGFGGGAYATWHKLQPILARTVRSCSY